MSERSRTTPSKATRDEEHRDATVEAGADEIEGPEPDDDRRASEDVAEHYEEMTELGARQRGEGRLP